MLNPIPKAWGVVMGDELRPLVLQNTCHNWFASSIAYQLKDLVAYITALQRKGPLKGRYIFEHLWDAFGSWSAIGCGAFTFIKFSKTFDSLTHVFSHTFFELMCLPPEYVNILIELSTAPMGGSSYTRESSQHRESIRASLYRPHCLSCSYLQ